MAGSIEIAPLAEALTFAREGSRILAVTSYVDGRIGAVDLSHLAAMADDDAIDLVDRLGYDALRSEIERASAHVACDAAELDVPVDLRGVHVAVGTNYRDHAAEATVKGGPFLFPKIVTPTSSRASIPAGRALLDYEVELCLVPLGPIAPGEDAAGGLILGNDVTDRAALLRLVDPRRPASGRGFTTGKSAPG